MATTPTQLSGLFKEVYGDSIIQLVPDSAKLVKMVEFEQRDKELGNKYHQPVIVQNEHGITYAAVDAGAFTLNAAISMITQDAQVQGSQMVLRSALSYDAAARASNSKKAFVKATQLLVENMVESITKRLEIACFYGATGLATTSSSANASATSTVITMTTASWATGMWAGMENAKINFYDAADALISSSTDSIFTITAVDSTNRKLTVSGTATGITALDTAIAAGACTVYFNGAHANEMSGIDKILTNTGTLFNVSAATYGLWGANTHSAGSAALTMGKLLNGIAKAVERGLDEDVDVFTNPKTWANLMSDLAALRRYDGSYDKRKLANGSNGIVFYGQNGEIRINSHNIVKEGEAFALPVKKLTRVGAQDISFKRPGRGDDEIILELADAAGYEMRCYTDQAIFLETPARAVKITSIVNAA